MENVDNQEESLETLRLMNAATTAVRLYSQGAPQIAESIENAYQGVKTFLRKHDVLHFSLLSDPPRLQGVPVDKRTREMLLLLTFDDRLRKMNLPELVLERRLDRKGFKNVIAVFASTPGQVDKAGGTRQFLKQLGVSKNFPDQYFAPGESKEEKKKKAEVERVVKELSQGAVRREQMLYMLGKQTDKAVENELKELFRTPAAAVPVIAATTYFLLQLLQKDHIVVVSPLFSQMIETIAALLDEEQYVDTAGKAAALLAKRIDDASVLMFSCQEFPTSFGEHFYNAQISLVSPESMKNILQWMEEQEQKERAGEKVSRVQVQVVSKAHERLQQTSKIKQLKAVADTQEELSSSEKERKIQRVQAGIIALAKGEMEGVANREVRQNLPVTIERLLANGKDSVAAAIVQNLVKGLQEKGTEHRLHFARSIGGVAVKLAELNRWDWLEKLVPVSLAWIRESETADGSYKNYLVALQMMMNHAWKYDQDDLAESILDTFYHIRSGDLDKSEEIQTLVARVQDSGVDAEVLKSYLDRCFEKPVDNVICRKICMQGPIAADFLIDILLESDRRADRIRLLKILTGVKKDLPPLLLKRLDKPMPWYGKRNIIRLLTETGTENDVIPVLKYVVHDDLRVTKEALNCIVRIGGELTQQFFLQVLPQATLAVKILILQELKRVVDVGAIGLLSEMLEECKAFSGSGKDELVVAICETLGATGDGRAAEVLQGVVDDDGKTLGKKGVAAARQEIAVIDEKYRLQENVYQELPSSTDSSAAGEQPEDDFDKFECLTTDPDEKKAYSCAEQGKKEEAKQLLMGLIEKSVHSKQFRTAEAFRLRLIDVDSMALADIIRAAEMIEEAKTASIDQDHIMIWSELYDALTTEEFNTFYHSLEHKKYLAEDVIVRQGDAPKGLFFINKGKVKLSFQEKGNETLVTVLKSGQVFGGTTFFDESVWTLTATSMGGADISCLGGDNLQQWEEMYPALGSKLKDFCLRFDQELSDFFLNSGADRREHVRYPLAGSVRMQVLDELGKNTDISLRGEGSDISRGGISFFARFSHAKHKRTLLGRNVGLSVECDGSDKPAIVRTGVILALRAYHSLEYDSSVHIRFDELLSAAEVERLQK